MAVYFIQCASGEIKIGTARDVAQRLNRLQTAHPEALRVLAVLPGGLGLERELHERFADIRVGGEWFAPAPRLVGFIEGLTFAADTRALFEEITHQGAHDSVQERIYADTKYGFNADEFFGGLYAIEKYQHLHDDYAVEDDIDEIDGDPFGGGDPIGVH